MKSNVFFLRFLLLFFFIIIVKVFFFNIKSLSLFFYIQSEITCNSEYESVQNSNLSTNVVDVQTDLFRFTIDLNGGDICSLILFKYFTTNSLEFFSFFNMSKDRYYFPQSGIIKPTDSVSFKLAFKSKKNSFSLDATDNCLIIDLVCTQCKFITMIKRYVVQRGSYVIKVNFIIKNESDIPFYGKSFYRFVRKHVEKNSLFSGIVGSFIGAAVNTKDSLYQKVSFKELEEKIFQQLSKDRWFAMVERYFVSAWLPENNCENYYVGESLGSDVYSISCFEKESFTINSGETKERAAKLYVGPAIASNLKFFSNGLDLAIDYGIFWPLAKIVFFSLCKINFFVNNWGFSIIFITIFIKLLFYPLSYISYMSMLKMKQLQPKINELKQLFFNDKIKLNTELMLLYKKKNLNSLSGCFPMLIQIPVFISLYYVILESIEFRNAHFLFWIHDLSSYDPFFVLPIIMGFSMFLQQRIIPTVLDDLQKKIMSFLPVVFIFLFLKFPAGLVLYWIINNTLSIIQQLIMVKKSNSLVVI